MKFKIKTLDFNEINLKKYIKNINSDCDVIIKNNFIELKSFKLRMKILLNLTFHNYNSKVFLICFE